MTDQPVNVSEEVPGSSREAADAAQSREAGEAADAAPSCEPREAEDPAPPRELADADELREAADVAPPREAREAGDAAPPREPRPWLERLGLAAVALVMAALFAVVAMAAGAGGEWILAAMSSVGALMTIAVAAITVVRG